MYHGHLNVELLDIGFSEWQQRGYPVTREAQQQKGKESDASEGSMHPHLLQVENKSNDQSRSRLYKDKTK